MTHLSRADMGAVLAFVTELGAFATAPERVDDWIVEHVADFVDADIASYAQVEQGHVLTHHAVFPGPPVLPTDDEWPFILHQNPFCQYAARTGDAFFSARRLTDVADRTFKRTQLSAIMGWGLPFDVQARMPAPRGSHWTLELARTGRDFSHRDLLVIDSLRPALIEHEAHRALVAEVTGLRRMFDVGSGPLPELSTRENEVLDHVALGRSNAQIARALWISPATVRKHLEHVYRKLEVGSRTEALARTGRSVSRPH